MYYNEIYHEQRDIRTNSTKLVNTYVKTTNIYVNKCICKVNKCICQGNNKSKTLF